MPTLPDMDVQLRLALIFFNLSPAALASWFQERYPEVQRRLPIDWYCVVLLGVCTASYAALGRLPDLRGHTPWGMMLAIGLGLGAVAIITDATILRLARHWRSRRVAEAPPLPMADSRFTSVPADIPATGVAWQARDQRPPWRTGLAALLIAAVLEECLYRQTLFLLLGVDGAAAAGGGLAPALLSTFFFGIIHFHYGLGGVISKWIIGALFAAAVFAGAGLAAVILAHAILNTAAWFALTSGTRAALFGLGDRVRA